MFIHTLQQFIQASEVPSGKIEKHRQGRRQ